MKTSVELVFVKLESEDLFERVLGCLNRYAAGNGFEEQSNSNQSS